jgi:hypothetical protein
MQQKFNFLLEKISKNLLMRGIFVIFGTQIIVPAVSYVGEGLEQPIVVIKEHR